MLREAVRFVPDNAEYRYSLSQVELKNPNWIDQGLANLKEAARLDSRRVALSAEAARALLEHKRAHEAEPFARRAVSLEPSPENEELLQRVVEASAAAPAPSLERRSRTREGGSRGAGRAAAGAADEPPVPPVPAPRLTAALTGLGLSAAAGLNAWVVLLLFNGLYRLLPQEFPGPAAEFLSSQPVLTATLILFLAEFVADKIPIVDHLWNLAQTLLRPVAGALLMLAAVPEASTAGRIGLAAAGAFVTLATHFAKSDHPADVHGGDPRRRSDRHLARRGRLRPRPRSSRLLRAVVRRDLRFRSARAPDRRPPPRAARAWPSCSSASSTRAAPGPPDAVSPGRKQPDRSCSAGRRARARRIAGRSSPSWPTASGRAGLGPSSSSTARGTAGVEPRAPDDPRGGSRVRRGGRGHPRGRGRRPLAGGMHRRDRGPGPRGARAGCGRQGLPPGGVLRPIRDGRRRGRRERPRGPRRRRGLDAVVRGRGEPRTLR